jgi:uncharacterized protein (TIGR02246 family)
MWPGRLQGPVIVRLRWLTGSGLCGTLQRRSKNNGGFAVKGTVLAVATLLLFGCAQPSGNSPAGVASGPDLKAQIDANNAAWAAAANRGDAAAVAAMYTDTATMLPPGMEMQKGRAAIQKTIAAIGGSGVRNFALTALDVAQVGPDTAREIGRVTADAPGPKKKLIRIEGKYVVIWKQIGGKWLLDVDIWNLNK